MIINIQITEEAIQYIDEKIGLGREAAEETSQTFISLCNISGIPTPKYAEERKLLRDLGDLLQRHEGNPVFEGWVFPPAIELRNALEQAIDETEEDLLFKTADSLMRFYAERGAKEYEARFGSLEVIETCRKILQEGEGNPHPWEVRR